MPTGAQANSSTGSSPRATFGAYNFPLALDCSEAYTGVAGTPLVYFGDHMSKPTAPNIRSTRQRISSFEWRFNAAKYATYRIVHSDGVWIILEKKLEFWHPEKATA